MSPETLRTLAGATLIAIPLWCLVVVLSFAVFRPVPRLAFAASPARPIAPVAPAPKPQHIMRYDVIKIDISLRGSGAAIHRAEQNGYTTIEKHDTVITMVKPNGRPVGQDSR